MSGHSVTKGVRSYKGKYLGSEGTNTRIQYTLTDTEGYGADSFSTDALKNQLIHSLKFETELNCIILVVSFERFRNGLKEDLNHLIGILQTLGLDKQHTVVVFTHCELFTDGVRAAYVKEFREYYSFDFPNENLIFGCFPNMGEVRQEFQQTIGEQVASSIQAVRAALKNKGEAVNVAMKISQIESA